MKSYIIVDKFEELDEDKTFWDPTTGYTEKEARERIDRYMSDNIGELRVYELDMETGQIREVDKEDLQRVLVPVRLYGTPNDGPQEERYK